MGRAGTGRAPSSRRTYASPSRRAGVPARGGSGDGSSTGSASPSPLLAGSVNMPETLKSTSEWRARRRPREEALAVQSFPRRPHGGDPQ